MNDQKELVVSFYDKSLDWLDEVDPDVKVSIYSKSDKDCGRPFKTMRNIGRCVHTFFSHIRDNYKTLSDYTFFCQDYPFDHVSNIVDIVNNFNPDSFKDSPWFVDGYWALLDDPRYYPILKCDLEGAPHHAGLNLSYVWNSLFDSSPPKEITFVPAGHFCIHSDAARMRSLSFYEKVVDILETRQSAPWEVERLEQYIFNPEINEKDLVRSL